MRTIWGFSAPQALKSPKLFFKSQPADGFQKNNFQNENN
jgi:hypothetical protein